MGRKKKKKWKDDYSKFSFASWNISSHLDVEWVPRREPCLPRKSLVSQSNRTQNHGAESRLTARRRENTLCYRRKGLFENVWRKLEEETVTRVGSSNFSTSSHWNTENVSSSFFRFTRWPLSHRMAPSLSSSLFVLLPLLSPLSHLKNLFLYTYFNSVIEDIKHTPLVWLLSSRRRNTIASFQNISFSDLISFLSRFFQVLIKLVVLSNSRITWR